LLIAVGLTAWTRLPCQTQMSCTLQYRTQN